MEESYALLMNNTPWWVEAEEIIKQNPQWAYYYARDVIKSRWVEAEEIIKQNPHWWGYYEKEIL